MRRIVAVLICWTGLGGFALGEDRDGVDFNREIRPLLSNRCMKCHGPDENARQASLRLDTRDGAVADLGGKRAIDLENPARSLLLARVASGDPEQRMPPPDAGPALSSEEIALLRRWIERGAPYDPHWAFTPLHRPIVSGPANPWQHHGIDAFVMERLAAKNINPSPIARRETRLRRLYLDLLGLPPEPAEVIELLSDESPDAFNRVIDRVLASPAYGERWGRHWLDQARYADTNGYTVDADRSIWPYRDWVISALNSDMPFDQFTVEQIAGDLLPGATPQQKVATGFHRNTLINQEGGTDPEQFRNEAVVDRVNTTGAVWLGLTIGCAQCHTHKYDPISQHDYYRMFAFFNSNQDVNSVAPTMRVGSAAQQQQLAELDKQAQSAKVALESYDRQQKAKQESGNRQRQPINWTAVELLSVLSEGGAALESLDDRSILASGKIAASDNYVLRFKSSLKRITGLRIETLVHPSLPQNGPGRAGNGNFVLSELEIAANSKALRLLHATADHSQPNYDVSKAIDGDISTGWAINLPGGKLNVDRTAIFVHEELDADAEAELTLTLRFGPNPANYSLGRFRVSVTDAPHTDFELPDPERARLLAAQQKAEEARKQLVAAMPETMIMGDLPQRRSTHVLIRGDFLRKGEQVEPGTPACLPGQANATPTEELNAAPASRLDLGRWLVDRRNPLTARVTVNRVWSRYFGAGLVETENDFGLNGTPPSHPELLTWLAANFIEGGWSQKKLHRQIVQSATWQQSSDYRADLEAVDPLNRLLGRQVRLRVDAEVVRDLGLAASGLLVSRMGGPSVYPPQPEGVYAFTQRAAVWNVSKGGDRYRRGLYTFFMRSVPYPMLTTFDTPKFNTTCTARGRSNTPLQSLTLANDDAMLEFARMLASRVLQFAQKDDERIRSAYLLCFGREPEVRERDRLIRYLEQQRTQLDAEAARKILAAGSASSTASAASEASATSDVHQTLMDQTLMDHAAWVLTSRVLLNLDEFITRD